MSKTISFTISEPQFKILKHEAESKGLKPSEYSRMAIFAYVNKYPSRGVFAELARTFRPEMINDAVDPYKNRLSSQFMGIFRTQIEVINKK